MNIICDYRHVSATLTFDLLILNLESSVRVTCDVGYLYANFSLPIGYASRFSTSEYLKSESFDCDGIRYRIQMRILMPRMVMRRKKIKTFLQTKNGGRPPYRFFIFRRLGLLSNEREIWKEEAESHAHTGHVTSDLNSKFRKLKMAAAATTIHHSCGCRCNVTVISCR